ncbi:MAG TPA: hypothetical protein VGX23_29570 [Actinocrinis sp.]|nr:hypothetical protein [Actinocrinis sp.]
MEHNILPSVHPDPWVDILRAYTGATVTTLARHGLTIHRSWLDPQDPRDATIVYTPDGGKLRALVWDEVAGWRDGAFVSGRQGVRTELDSAVHLCGKLLPTGGELAWSLRTGVTAPAKAHRSYGDTHDGLDDRLRQV